MAEPASSLATSFLREASSVLSSSSPSTGAYLNAQRVKAKRLGSDTSRLTTPDLLEKRTRTKVVAASDQEQPGSKTYCRHCGEIFIPGVNAYTALERVNPAAKRKAKARNLPNAYLDVSVQEKKRVRRAGKRIQRSTSPRHFRLEREHSVRAIVITTCRRCSRHSRTSFIAKSPSHTVPSSGELSVDSEAGRNQALGKMTKCDASEATVLINSGSNPKRSTRKSRHKSQPAKLKGLLQIAGARKQHAREESAGVLGESQFNLMDFMKP